MDGLSRLQTFHELLRSFAILGIELSLHCKFEYAVTKGPLQVLLNCAALIAQQHDTEKRKHGGATPCCN